MRKIQGPESKPPRDGERKNPFKDKDPFMERRYDQMRSQLAYVEGQLRESFRKRERLEEYCECSEAQELHAMDWVKYQSAAQKRKEILSELRYEAFSVALGLFAKSMIWVTAAAGIALFPVARFSGGEITPTFLFTTIGCLALVALYQTRKRIRDGAPEVMGPLAERIEERITDLESERKALTKKIFGVNPGKDE
jgi:hypothetical protein